MTQTTSISSMNKKSFLKKAFKGLSSDNTTNQKSELSSNLPVSNKLNSTTEQKNGY
ncbi:hypothetical protein [Maridesulfovibrio ferrireducens]|uniref:hypothetical protein n=1 Tax=Maridesulfovibrio ferrireducens TaxID=246191 RepID=UPI001A2E1B80|nr:hypothetical protein [Maridesulfovibrio ferrireducens]MBI9112937.1 hypothetical protein [Maridesulfovibrio ferrireducens]